MKNIRILNKETLKSYETRASAKIQEHIDALDILKRKVQFANGDNTLISKSIGNLVLNILLFVVIVLYAVLIPKMISLLNIENANYILINKISLYCNCMYLFILLVKRTLKYSSYYKRYLLYKRIVNLINEKRKLTAKLPLITEDVITSIEKNQTYLKNHSKWNVKVNDGNIDEIKERVNKLTNYESGGLYVIEKIIYWISCVTFLLAFSVTGPYFGLLYFPEKDMFAISIFAQLILSFGALIALHVILHKKDIEISFKTYLLSILCSLAGLLGSFVVYGIILLVINLLKVIWEVLKAIIFYAIVIGGIIAFFANKNSD